MNWFKIATIANISAKEYENRLKAVGFQTFKNSNGHIEAFHPSGIRQTFSPHTWSFATSGPQRQMQSLRQAFMHQGRKGEDFKALDFIFKSPFIIPDGFDIKTLSYKPKDKVNTVQIDRRISPDSLLGLKIISPQDGKEKTIEDVEVEDWKDYALSLFLSDETIQRIKQNEKLTILV